MISYDLARTATRLQSSVSFLDSITKETGSQVTESEEAGSDEAGPEVTDSTQPVVEASVPTTATPDGMNS